MAPMPNARRHPRARRLLALLAAGGLAVAMAAACGGGGDDEAGTDPTTSDEATTTPSTTAPVTPEDEAKAVYLELVDVVYGLLTTNPDPNDADLIRLAVDPVLGNFQDSLATMQAENQIVERGDQTRQEVLSSSIDGPQRVVLEVCSRGNDRRLDRDDNSVVSEGASTRVLEAVVISNGQNWQVSEVNSQQAFDGLVECPAH